MGKRFDLGASQAQASSCQQSCTELGNSIQQISAAVAQAASSNVSGMGSAHVKEYAESVVVPMLQAAIMLSEAAKQGTTKLPQQYVAKVDSKSHSEDELQEEVASAKSEISMIDGIQKALNKIDKSAGDKFVDATKGARTDAQARLQKAEQILQNFRNYDVESGGLFGDIDELGAAFDQGAHVMQSATVVNGGAFELPIDLEWSNYIKRKWKKYGSKILNNLEKSDLFQTGKETVWEKLKDEGVSLLRSGIEKGGDCIKEGYLDDQLDLYLGGDLAASTILLKKALLATRVGKFLSKGFGYGYVAYQYGKSMYATGKDLNKGMNPGKVIVKDDGGIIAGGIGGGIAVLIAHNPKAFNTGNLLGTETWNYLYRKPWFRHGAIHTMEYVYNTKSRNLQDIEKTNRKYHTHIPLTQTSY